jgi:uncharacterized protein (DUF2141 family)
MTGMTPMKSIAAAALLCAGLLLTVAVPASAQTIGADAASCTSGHGPAILVNVQGLKDRTGELWLELYPYNADDFLRGEEDLAAAHKVFRRARSRMPAGGAISICVRVPAPGRYALMLRHNRTGKDKFSVWSDGAGIPANQSLGRSRPKLSQAMVNAGPAVTTLTIKMQYLHGFGFSAL